MFRKFTALHGRPMLSHHAQAVILVHTTYFSCPRDHIKCWFRFII